MATYPACAAAAAAAGPIMNCCIGPATTHLGYLTDYKANVEELGKAEEDLGAAKSRTEILIRNAEEKGELIHDDVKKWLERVDGKIGEALEILKETELQANRRCYQRICSEVCSRYDLGKKAYKIVAESRVLSERNFPEGVGYHPRLPLFEFGNRDFHALPSRSWTKDEIMKALNDPEIYSIGIWGMRGMGKTSLVNEVARQVNEDGLFDKVIMVDVTSRPNYAEIQKEIAKQLGNVGAIIDEEDGATKLYRGIKEVEKTIMILDGIWESFDLKKIGIPFPGYARGCKIIVTSRNEVALRPVEAQRKFCLEFLSPEESWNLFQSMAGGEVVNNRDLEETAREIVKNCYDWPQIIVDVAKRLKSEFENCVEAWEDALTRFKGDAAKFAKSALGESYTHLEDKEAKSLLLFCCAIGSEKISVDDLAKYYAGLESLANVTSIRDIRNRIYSHVKRLKAGSLSCNTDGDEKHVYLHSLVRDFAYEMAFRDCYAYSTAHDPELREWGKDASRKCAVMSFTEGIVPSLGDCFDCPQLEFFCVRGSSETIRISDHIFEQMGNLKVVNLIGLDCSVLPSSLGCLSKLHTLCLDCCDLGNMNLIGNITTLKVLSLSQTNVEELCKEIGQLVNLRSLDISNCSRLRVIPSNVLSELKRLEELYMEGCHMFKWEGDGISNRGENANLCELRCLSGLTTLQISVDDIKILPKNIFPEALKRFKVRLGSDMQTDENVETQKQFIVKCHPDIIWGNGIKGLVRKSEELYLDELEGDIKDFYESDKEGLRNLKHFYIQNCLEMVKMIDATRGGPSDPLPFLESLSLNTMPKLENIIYGKTSRDSFRNLRRIKVKDCDSLKSLFCSTHEGFLYLLQEVDVRNCDMLEHIFLIENELSTGTEASFKLVFGKLSCLKLFDLPKLDKFCSKVISSPPTQSNSEITSEDDPSTSIALFSEKVSFPALKHLTIEGVDEVKMIWHNQLPGNSFCNILKMNISSCSNLIEIFPSNMVRDYLVNLQELTIMGCDLVEEIFQLSEPGVEGEDAMTGCLLRSLKLLSLPNLKRVWGRGCGKNFPFPNLQVVEVKDCLNLQSLFPVAIAKNLKKLETISIGNCGLNQIVAKQTELRSEEVLLEFEFLELRSMELKCLEKLQTFYPGVHTSKWPSLRRLWIKKCDKLKSFGSFTARNWEFLNITVNPSLFSTKEEAFPNIKELSLWSNSSMEEIWNAQSNPLQHSNGISRMTSVLSSLETLKVVTCGISCSFVPSSISFRYLTTLKVSKCDVLETLFFPPTAQSLCQLHTLSISECRALKTVISDGREEVEDEIVFPSLVSLELFWLPNLTSFYLSNTNAAEFDSTDEVINFQALFTSKVSCPSLKYLMINGMKLLKRIWQDELTAASFSNIEVLGIQSCDNLTKIFHSNILKVFRKLRKLSIAESELVEEIFDIPNSAARETGNVAIYQLASLELSSLPRLENIWQGDHQSVLSFKNLQEVKVEECEGLKSIFPASLAKDLRQLECLHIKNCGLLKEIIAGNTRSEMEVEEFAFPSIKSLIFEGLRQLETFYSCMHTSDWTSLKILRICGCDKLKTFGSEVSRITETMNLGQLPLFLTREVLFPNLQELTVMSNGEMKEIWCGPFHRGLFGTPRVVRLSFFSSEFAQILHECEEFIVKNDITEEGDAYEGLHIGDEMESNAASRLRRLCISNAPKLMRLLIKNCQMNSVIKYLKDLEVQECGVLRDLVPLSITFGNLTSLRVAKCPDMETLLTPSTARSLIHLTKLCISNCGMLYTIVADGEVEGDDEITFPKLQRLGLFELSNLGNFYSGRCTIKFPSLEDLTLKHECPRMEKFSGGIAYAHKLRSISISNQSEEDWWTSEPREAKKIWKGDINATIKHIWKVAG